MNCKGVHTAEVLPEIIDGLRKKGFTLVTVGEMLKKDKDASGTAGPETQTGN